MTDRELAKQWVFLNQAIVRDSLTDATESLAELLASVREAATQFAADCIEELEYVQCSKEACGSNMCASDRGRELIERGKKMLPAPPEGKE